MAIKDVRLIDANALLEAICKKCPEYDCIPDTTDTVSGCLIYDVIASAPTIDAQPAKRGKWMYSTTIGGMRYYRCTNCTGEERDCIADENDVRWYNFCPNCGAKMCGGDTDGDQV